MDAKKKTITNSVFGFVSQLVIIIMGLVIPRIVLVSYGSDTNGLTNTIGQIFTYMALLEAGISVSARNAFYKPIKENDKSGISFVASLAKRYYRKISIIYLFIVVCLSIALPYIFKTSISYWTICLYTLFEGLTSVVSFYFINTWVTFLQAKGETYIINIFSLIGKVLCYCVKITLSLMSYNIVYIQIGYFGVSLIVLFLYRHYMMRKYGWINYSYDTKNEKLKDKNANLLSEIAWVVFSSTDMIVISAFISTSASSVYAIYNNIYLAINTLLFSVYSAVNYHLGLIFNSGDMERYKRIHDAFMTTFVGSMCMLMSICYYLILPFVKLYTNGVTDVNYVYKYLPILFCLVQILSWSRYVTGNLIGISFRQKPAIKINIIEAVTNLLLSIILVVRMGIEGVLLATVIALPLKVIYCTYVSDRIILKRDSRKTITILICNYLTFGTYVIIHHYVNLQINSIVSFVSHGIVISVVIGISYVFLNMIVNKDIVKVIKLLRKD